MQTTSGHNTKVKNQRSDQGTVAEKGQRSNCTIPEGKWTGKRFAFGCHSILLLTEEKKQERAQTAFDPIFSHIR